MPDIDITHPHSLGKQGCRAAVNAVASDLAARFGLNDMTWQGDRLGFEGHGVEGTLTVGEREARVQMRLGPLLALLRPAIEAEIRQRLRQYLG